MTSSLARRLLRPELLVALVALIPRVGYVLRCAGGYGGTFEYDPSVYYGAAVAMLHGRLPYSDFVLVHPPGIAVVLLPFAVLGHLTTDDAGFVSAQIAFAVIGAVNAALVVRLAHRVGYGAGAAVAGGFVYALWPGATGAEFGSRLEPLGNLAVLLGLLAYFAAERSGRRLPAVLAGAALGFAVSVKVWWLLTLLVVVVWSLARQQGRRRLPLLLGGTLAAFVAIDLPFFLAAPRRMVELVLTDQTDRSRLGSFALRLRSVDGFGYMDASVSHPILRLLGLAFLVAVAALCVVGVRATHGALWVALTALPLVALFVTPSFFAYYDDFVTPGLALLVAAAVHRGRVPAPTARGPLRRALVPGVVVACLAAAVVDIALPREMVKPYPTGTFAPVVARSRCVMSDSPMPLIMLDVLDRDLGRGCRDWNDVTGRSLPILQSGPGRRADNPRWQAAVGRYLLSGDTVTIFRRFDTGIADALNHKIRRCPVLAGRGPFRVFRVTRACRTAPAN